MKTIFILMLSVLLFWCTQEWPHLEINSPDFSNNWYISDKFTCIWDDTNPELKFTNIPNETKSLTLIMDDTDSPWWEWLHWLIWNMLPSNNSIIWNDKITEAKEWLNSWWEAKYSWPCPPSWTHKYNFRLFALDKVLDLPDSATKSDLLNAMSWSVIEEAVLIWKYKKK